VKKLMLIAVTGLLVAAPGVAQGSEREEAMDNSRESLAKDRGSYSESQIVESKSRGAGISRRLRFMPVRVALNRARSFARYVYNNDPDATDWAAGNCSRNSFTSVTCLAAIYWEYDDGSVYGCGSDVTSWYTRWGSYKFDIDDPQCYWL
jgi:hypothetical protein